MFVFVLYLARFLGIVEYGKFEFALSIGYLIGMFFELGGNMILTKHVARNFYSSIYYAVKIRLLSIFIVLFVFYAILFFSGIYSESRIFIIYASIGIAFSSMMNLYFAFFRGVRKMNYEAYTLIFQKVLFVFLSLILIFSDKSAANALIAFMISMIIGFIIIFFVFKKNESLYINENENQDISFKSYIKDVFTLALVEVFSNIYYKLNQVFIEHYKGYEEVGAYGVAYKIVEVFINFPSILLIALFPAFAKIAVQNLNEFRIQFNKMLIFLFVFGFISSIICWYSGEFIFVLIGSEYEKSYLILRYLTIPLLFLFPNFLVTQGLIALDKNIIFAIILLIALFLNIITSIILVPIYGAIGSALSIGICEIVIFSVGFFYIKKYTTIG